MRWIRSRTAVVTLVVTAVAALTIALGSWQGWTAEAQTVRWVNDADDAGEPTECSTATAYADIASALAASADGDIIRLCEGTHSARVDVNTPVTIEGREGVDRADVVLEVPTGPTATDGLVIDADDVTIRHLTLDGPGPPDGGTPPTIAIEVPLGPPPGPERMEISDVEITEMWRLPIGTAP